MGRREIGNLLQSSRDGLRAERDAWYLSTTSDFEPAAPAGLDQATNALLRLRMPLIREQLFGGGITRDTSTPVMSSFLRSG